jgi:misacylated tRNA(Ala) deacylase
MIPQYMKECYLKEFWTLIKSVHGVQIILEDTIFYPESGGQPTDTGKLVTEDGQEFIVNSVKKQGDEIVHEVMLEGLTAGERILCVVDWNRRYKYMRYHTALHILSTLIHLETGAEITGNQIKDDESRIDFSLENFDRNLMQSYEDKANEIIARELPVHLRVLPREKAFEIPSLVKLRKMLPESIKEIRIVEVQDFDIQACGGTHIANTREIGKLKITKLENKGKERRRIYIQLV